LPPFRAESPHRYAALDGWRGLSAVLVALYHWRGQLGYQVNSHLAEMPFIRNAYLFVDFFFVLSGFVIAARYQDALAERTVRFRDFVALRIGRLWPLQIFTLLLMLVVVRAVLLKDWGWIDFRTPAEDISARSFALNVFLLQGMHTTGMLTWNHPSWSISAEFFTYIAFALAWLAMRRMAWLFAVTMLVAMPVLLLQLKGHMDATYDWGFLRSVFGFAAGVLVFNAMRGERVQAAAKRLTTGVATIVELALTAGVVAFVSLAGTGPASIAAPVVFALTVAAFSLQRGALGRVLLLAPAQLLGKLSYSIYLLQFPLQQLLMFAAIGLASNDVIERETLFLFPPGARFQLGATQTVGDMTNVVMLIVLIGAAALTYRWVESPGRAYVRRRVAARGARMS
jgi:peptidoglycan/LPS O-acetylase OafA/YrhL